MLRNKIAKVPKSDKGFKLESSEVAKDKLKTK